MIRIICILIALTCCTNICTLESNLKYSRPVGLRRNISLGLSHGVMKRWQSKSVILWEDCECQFFSYFSCYSYITLTVYLKISEAKRDHHKSVMKVMLLPFPHLPLFENLPQQVGRVKPPELQRPNYVELEPRFLAQEHLSITALRNV